MLKTHLATRWLGEPQGPLVRQRVLDIEVILVVEDCDRPTGVERGRRGRAIAVLGWRDRDCGEIDLLRHRESNPAAGGDAEKMKFLKAREMSGVKCATRRFSGV